MHQTRLHIPGTYTVGSELRLEVDKAHYLGRVLRRKTGDGLLIFDGDGNEFTATIRDIGKGCAVLHVDEETAPASETSLRVHLVQGMSRGERMDFVVQKATELGVKRITPVLTAHGVVKLDEKRALKRRDHWQKVAASACEQSGRVRLPLIDTPLTLATWWALRPERIDVQLVLQPGAAMPLAGITPPDSVANAANQLE